MDFRDYLKRDAVILFDGAMGTELARRGLAMSGLNNLSHPDRVLEIHRDYLEAGAEVIITNTFTMNRINLVSHGLEIDVREVNLAGAGLARRAAGGGYVCGDLSSTGQLLEPYGSCSEKEFYDNFK
ncbi:MAG: homocysteine methyltransferase, partial [Firmicutes bacterium]|nr:homocysteine methyltransferase [Bacillota bacterium]